MNCDEGYVIQLGLVVNMLIHPSPAQLLLCALARICVCVYARVSVCCFPI